MCTKSNNTLNAGFLLFSYKFVFYIFHPGTLKAVISLLKPGASVKEICEKGDQLLLEETGKVSIFSVFMPIYVFSVLFFE